MEGRSVASATKSRSRDAFKTPNLSKPPTKAVTVSAAGPFKAQKLDTHLQASIRGEKKSAAKKFDRKNEKAELHPLALAFKEKSEGYRRQLYSVVVARIYKDRDALLNKLYESNLQAVSSASPDDDSQASPLKLTIPAKYQRNVQQLYRPLSSYRYNLQRTKTSGEIERTQTSLQDRFQALEETMQAETEQVKELQRQWESVVAEIFQLSVTCLGETDIAALLSTADAASNVSSPASKAESTLFVPEDSNSDRKARAKRKRVSFASPDLMALFPEFLFHAPGGRESIGFAPVLPTAEVERFKTDVSVLGKKHSADLHRIEHEHRAWWVKKQKHLAHTFMQD